MLGNKNSPKGGAGGAGISGASVRSNASSVGTRRSLLDFSHHSNKNGSRRNNKSNDISISRSLLDDSSHCSGESFNDNDNTKSNNNASDYYTRSSRHNTDTSTNNKPSSSTTAQPLPIHQMCLLAPTAQDLVACNSLVTAPMAATTDAQGRLPLHCVAMNKQLADALAFNNNNNSRKTKDSADDAASVLVDKQDGASASAGSVEQQLITFVVDKLLDAYPAAMISPDSTGKIPFEGFLRDWVASAHEPEKESTTPKNKGRRTGLMRTMSRFQVTPKTPVKPPVEAYGFKKSAAEQPAGGGGIPMTPLVGKKASLGTVVEADTPSSTASHPPMTPLGDGNRTPIQDITMTPLQLGIDLNNSNPNLTPNLEVEMLFSHTSPKRTRKNSDSNNKKDTTAKNDNDNLHEENGRGYAAQKFSEWDMVFPKQPIRLTAQAYYSFKMLSAIVDYFDKHLEQAAQKCRNSLVYRPDSVTKKSKASSDLFSTHNLQDQLRTITESDLLGEIVESIARIPQFIKIVLLMDDADQRQYVLHCSIVRRVLASRQSVGGWLPAMFQSDELRVAERAIVYLDVADEAASKCSSSNKSSNNNIKGGSARDGITEEEDDAKRFEIYNEIARLQDFVPSLLSLRERQVEEASTTRLVIGVLDRIIARPFCMSVVVIDVVFMALTIASYRASVDHLLLGYPSETILRYIYLANIGIFYFIIRELGKAISLCMITNRPSIYFLSFWNLIDLWSTLLLLSSVVAIRAHLASDVQDAPDWLRNLMAIATGFFWLRVLNFLKGINMQLATFVLAIIHITRDVVWFAVILFILVISFAQMFFTLLAPGYCAAPNDPGTNTTDIDIKDYPECVQAEYYLKIYSIFIFQEFDREEFTTVFSVLLIVLYSFMVVLVLLNVLIAIASDSYEKCLVRGQNLFGRARVMMVAELVSFQNLLRRNSTGLGVYKGWWSRDSVINGWSRGSVVFFSLSLLVIVTWIIAETAGYLLGPGDGNVFLSLGSIFVNVALFVGMMFFLTSGAGDIVARLHVTNAGTSTADNNRLQSIRSGSMNFLYKAVLRLLGSSGHDRSQAAQSNDVWGGRLRYLEDRMIQVSEETREDTSDKVKKLETSLRNDLIRIEQSLALMQDNCSPGVVISGLPTADQVGGGVTGMPPGGASITSGGKSVDKTLMRILDILHTIRAKVDDKPGQN